MSPASRAGAGLLRLLALLTALALGLALVWAVLANRGQSGAWSFRPFDGAWWTASRPRGPDDPVVDGVVRTSRELAGQARDALWGPGGLVERGEAWWKGAPAPAAGGPATGAPAAGAPATTPPAAGAQRPAGGAPALDERARLELELAKADSGFRAALDHLARASPATPGDAATKQAHAAAARTSLREADARLTLALGAYAAIPGHDVQRLERGRQLAGWIQQLGNAVDPR